jgi:hypothetical protein
MKGTGAMAAKRRKQANFPGRVSDGGPSLSEDDLEVEIKSLRTQARKVWELAREEDGLKEAIQALNALGTAFTRLAHLLESRKKLAGGKSEYDQALEQVLAKINQEDELQRQEYARKAAQRSQPGKETDGKPKKERKTKHKKNLAVQEPDDHDQAVQETDDHDQAEERLP